MRCFISTFANINYFVKKMKRLLFTTLVTLLFSSTILAQEIEVPMSEQRVEDKAYWEKGKRARSIISIEVTHDENAVYIYSNVLLDDLQVIIKDSADNEIYSATTTVIPDQRTSINLLFPGSGQYKIELNIGDRCYFGYFEVDSSL